MRELHTHCQCDNCTGEDCGQDNPEEYEKEQERERVVIRQEVLDELTKWRESEEYHLGMFHKTDEYRQLWKKEWVFIKELHKQEQP